jgi:transposase InsO family protein
VSTSGFYDWCQREAAGPTPREVAEAELVELMRGIFDASDGNYGVPRMFKELRRAGLVINKKRVRRLMRLHGMAGRCRRRRCRTTFPGPDGYVISDLVGRCFAPGAPDHAWVQDITYIATGEGWLYLASVLDLGSRRLLGYSMADHMRTELVLDALTIGRRRPRRHRGRRDRPRRPRLAVHLQRLPRVLPHPPAATLSRPHRRVLGQRRGRVVLGITQT